jgi:hypothetical protein
MPFADAVQQFRSFLAKQGHTEPLLWNTPSDLLLRSGELLVRPSENSETDSQRLFAEAETAGFGVALEAVAKLDHSICCFVFKPANAQDAGDHFVGPPLTMKVRQELKVGREAGPIEWWLIQRISTKRNRILSLQFFGYDLDRR